ncbi:MAG: hypothetical protein IPK16_29050 [Anaerolineales bacterium]|nr:hypothetical protein [Anaerolineales bacterium]
MTTVAFGLSAVLRICTFAAWFRCRFIGLVLGAGQLAWAVAALPAGMVSSRIGLRNGYMLGPALFAVGTALMLLVETQPEAIWPVWLIGSQVVVMVGTAFITVNVAPYLMSVTGEEAAAALCSLSGAIPATAFLGSVMADCYPFFRRKSRRQSGGA